MIPVQSEIRAFIRTLFSIFRRYRHISWYVTTAKVGTAGKKQLTQERHYIFIKGNTLVTHLSYFTGISYFVCHIVQMPLNGAKII